MSDKSLIQQYHLKGIHQYELLKHFTYTEEDQIYCDVMKLLKKYDLSVEELIDILNNKI